MDPNSIVAMVEGIVRGVLTLAGHTGEEIDKYGECAVTHFMRRHGADAGAGKMDWTTIGLRILSALVYAFAHQGDSTQDDVDPVHGEPWPQ